jgi:hypothetical protein
MASVTINPSKPLKLYGFNSVTSRVEVSALIDKIRRDLGRDMNKVMIYVLSGTHGDEDGNLVGEKIFFLEDRSKELQTVKAVNVDGITPANTWKTYFGKSQSILILAWCFSNRWKGLATYNI